MKDDGIGQKLLLILHQLILLPSITWKGLVFAIAFLVLSEPLIAASNPISLKKGELFSLAQQPVTAEQEVTRAAAKRAYQEGFQLYQQKNAQSRQQALQKWQEALPLYQAIGDKQGEAVTLLFIGKVYDDLGEKQKALEFYNQSLPLFRAIGDKTWEGINLNNIGLVYAAIGEPQKALEYYNQSLPLSGAVGDKKGEALTLNNIGAVYDDLGEKQKALEYYNQSLSLRRTVDDKAGEAITLSNIGKIYSDLGEKQKALEYYNQSLPLKRAVGDKAGEALTLNNIGAVYDDLGEKQKALEFYNQSLSLTRTVSNKYLEALILSNIGKVHSDLGEKQKALEYYNQSLPLRRAISDKAGEAITLNNIGGVYSDLGEKQKALEYYNQSLPLARAIENKTQEALILSNMGKVYSDLGEKQKALELYNQSLPLRRAVGDKAGEAVTLINIGKAYSDWGEKQKALEFYNQALSLTRTIGDKAGEAITLNNIALVYDDLGEKQKALELYNQSLPLRRTVGDKAGEAITLLNIGKIYDDLGQKQQALQLYNQSLLIRKAIGDKSGEGVTLNNIGKTYSDLGQPQKALEIYNQSLSLRRAVGDKDGEAVTLSNIGAVYWVLDQPQKALEFYNQSLPLRRVLGDKSGEAITLNNIGAVYGNLNQPQKALEFYNQSLPLRRTVGDKEGEALTLYNIAYLERQRGNFNEALTQVEAAIKLIENLRTKITSQELRASYFASKQDYYKFYIDLLMQLHKQQPSKGYDALALHTNERARARSLLEILTEANADIRQGVDPNLLEQERNLQQQLNALEQNRVKLLSSQYSNRQLTNIKQEIENLLTQLEFIKAQIRAKSPRYAALKYPEPLTLEQIQQQVLDDDTLLLEYSLGQERSYLWAVTKTGITSYELPKQVDIEAVAQQFYNQVNSPQLSSPEIGQKLSQMLLAPVASQLGNKRLLIVNDGALQSIPFAALPVPNAQGEALPVMLVNHEIVSLPSASTVAVLRRELKGRKLAPKTLVAIADPVFSPNDPRFKSSSPQPSNVATLPSEVKRSASAIGVVLDRLQYSRTEAQTILALVPESQRFSAFDFNASRTTATRPDLSQYRLIHFATHGLLNNIHPELSGVVLSLVDPTGNDQDGFLRLHDIYNLTLPAELVVLSACETGLGKQVQGEGLIGLTRGFMYAGAKRVTVSLWNVNDLATAELMKRFYQQMLEKELNPVAALRAAQLEMMKTDQWQAPYYWASFVVQGEWK
jgi:CHAT domain-containing protein/tetratricopeptide (TPR) repeat protein